MKDKSPKTGRIPFNIRVEEKFLRNVVIYAHDSCEACEIAEELCSNGNIDLDAEDFSTRDVSYEGEASASFEEIHQTFYVED